MGNWLVKHFRNKYSYSFGIW